MRVYELQPHSRRDETWDVVLGESPVQSGGHCNAPFSQSQMELIYGVRNEDSGSSGLGQFMNE